MARRGASLTSIGKVTTEWQAVDWPLTREQLANLAGVRFQFTGGKTYLWDMDLSGTMQGAGWVGGLLSVYLRFHVMVLN